VIVWYCFCGFEIGGDALVYQRTLECDEKQVKAALNPDDIADDPGLAHVYPIAIEVAQAIVGENLPAGDYFVNGVQSAP
jgi:hypothetical protein